MQRRDFIAASGLLAVLPFNITAKLRNEDAHYLEWIVYHARVGPARRRVADFYRDVAIPAYGRLGVSPVGVFSVVHGETSPSLHALVAHETLESAVTAGTRLLADDTFLADGTDFLDTALTDPAYVRQERRLMVCFDDMPRLEVPELGDSRVFELRIYESHSVKAGQKKIDMFNEGGEIAIFRKVGLTPVFFGKTLFGPAMPNLTYMLAFDGTKSMEEAWARFSVDPDWIALKADPQYADTVSNITDIILRPEPYSEI